MALRYKEEVPVWPTQQSPHEVDPHSWTESRRHSGPWNRTLLHWTSYRNPFLFHSFPRQFTSILPSCSIRLHENGSSSLRPTEGAVPHQSHRAQVLPALPVHHPEWVQGCEPERRWLRERPHIVLGRVCPARGRRFWDSRSVNWWPDGCRVSHRESWHESGNLGCISGPRLRDEISHPAKTAGQVHEGILPADPPALCPVQASRDKV